MTITTFFKRKAQAVIENHIRAMADSERYDADSIIEDCMPDSDLLVNLHISVDWEVTDCYEFGDEVMWEYTGKHSSCQLYMVKVTDADGNPVSLSPATMEAINELNDKLSRQ